MSNKNKIAVKILGHDHYLISTDDPNYVYKVAKIVDDRMNTILKSNSALSHTKIAILTALNLADDLSKCRKKIEEKKTLTAQPKVALTETKKQISSLASHVSKAEGLYDNMLNEFDVLKSTREKQGSQMRSLTDELKVLCGDIEKSDGELLKANNRIAELEEKLLMRENEIAEYIKVFDEIELEKLQEVEKLEPVEKYDAYSDDIIYEDDLEK